jgi:uncharacterized protein (DUF2147 family)
MIREFIIPTLFGAALALPFAAQAQAAGGVEGVWRNPKNTVHIQIKPCGTNLCGYVVWATPKAKADAKEAGTDPLVGAQLFRNFESSKTRTWKGRVFVPDMNATFGGSAQLVDANTLKAKGCLIAGLVCKAQNWKRVS